MFTTHGYNLNRKCAHPPQLHSILLHHSCLMDCAAGNPIHRHTLLSPGEETVENHREAGGTRGCASSVTSQQCGWQMKEEQFWWLQSTSPLTLVVYYPDLKMISHPEWPQLKCSHRFCEIELAFEALREVLEPGTRGRDIWAWEKKLAVGGRGLCRQYHGPWTQGLHGS